MIVTHTRPDMDAITSTWLLARYYPKDLGEITLTSDRDPNAAIFADAAAVCDTGGVYQPTALRFDHHHDPDLPSATMLVWRHLESIGVDVTHLKSLVTLVDDGDMGRSSAAQSYVVGIHALLTAAHATYGDDWAVWSHMTKILDTLDVHLRRRYAATCAVISALQYASKDRCVVGIHGDSVMARAAADGGATLVVWNDTYERDGQVCHTLGCARYGDAVVNVGDLVRKVMIDRPDLAPELSRWYLHPAGFVATVGSPKAEPRHDAPTVTVEALAEAIDAAWGR